MAFTAFLSSIIVAAFAGVFLMVRRSLRDQHFWLSGELAKVQRELESVRAQAANAAAAADRAARIITVATRPPDELDPEAIFLRAHSVPSRWRPARDESHDALSHRIEQRRRSSINVLESPSSSGESDDE